MEVSPPSPSFSYFSIFYYIQIAERKLLFAALTTHLNVQHYYDDPLAPFFFSLNAFNTARDLIDFFCV